MSSFNNIRNQNGRDAASNWGKTNPVLLSGDGSKRYTQLPFQGEALYNVLNSKQDTLVFDSVPMPGSKI